ncbi:MAG: YXWGXW repeat-containing protein [Myxococcales bacterium]|nr:YXWGXW repeat-containing protein [Myxococcales bacterium]
MRTTLLAAALMSALALPAVGQAQVTVTIVPPTAPPRPAQRVIVQPTRPAANYVWVDGYWDWDPNSQQWYWVDGYWIENRPGYVIVPPRWVQQNGQWVYYDGGWAQPNRPAVVVHRVPARGRRVVVRPPAPRATVRPAPAPGRVVVQPPRRGPAYRQERRDDRRDFRQERRDDRREFRQERRDDRRDLRRGNVTPQQYRQDRRDDRRDARQDRRQDRRDYRQDRRQDRRAAPPPRGGTVVVRPRR